MPAAFDHVIVGATIDGIDYWLDGTSSGASLAVAAEVPPFQHALPIREGGAELIALEQRAQTAWDLQAEITFDHRSGSAVAAAAASRCQALDSSSARTVRARLRPLFP